MDYPQNIKQLIESLTTLPGVGQKTAERYVFSLLKQPATKIQEMIVGLNNLSNIKYCEQCLTFSDTNLCHICSDKTRNSKQLCIVENIQDMISIEKTNQYQGKYFVLGTLLNTIANIGPKDINIEKLVKNINTNLKDQSELEIILALSPTIEGETTALYLVKILSSPRIKMTRLARGLSTGSSLEYADELTLTNALKYRNEL